LHPNRSYVHVFDELALDVVMRELDTINDFCNYLDEKVKFIRDGKVISAAGEEELIGFFCSMRGRKHEKGAFIHPTGNVRKDGPIAICEGIYKKYIQSEAREYYNQMRFESQLVDRIIEEFSQGIINAQVGLGSDLEFGTHEFAVRFLASECRYSRFLISWAIKEKYSALSGEERTSRLIFSPEFENRLFVLLFFWPPGDEEDFESYRQVRRAHLDAYALVAKWQHPKAEFVIVLATESSFSSPGRSHDIMVREFSGPMAKEDIETAKELSREHDILSQTVTSKRRIAQEASAKRKVKIGRNSPCPCGSGVKYKKCCL